MAVIARLISVAFLNGWNAGEARKHRLSVRDRFCSKEY